jgi:RNA polymerase sigma-70 factor (ECF subfamily)
MMNNQASRLEDNAMTGPDRPDPELIYRQYAQSVSRLCGRMIRNRETARDTAQEIWFEILKSLPDWTGRSSIGTWVWTIAHRTVWKHLRREKVYSTRFMAELFAVREADGLDEMDRIPVEDRQAWIRLECDECLTGILHCVQNDDRFIYLLRTLARLGFGEIAAVMESNETTVRQSHNRARRKLNHFLNAQCLLYNPDGQCRCKMKAPIKAVEKSAEYRKVRELSKRILFMEAAESFHPPKEYWQGLLASASDGPTGTAS